MDENVKVWEPNKPHRGLDMKKFAKQNRDIVRNLIIMLVVVLVSCLIVRGRTIAKMKVEMQIAVLNATQETTARLREEYGVDAAEAEALTIAEEAKSLAKMLYPMQYNTDNGLKSACWCAINRVDSRWYPDTIDEVCSQESQWMGWSDSNPVVERLYNIAYQALAQWHSGIHAIGSDFLYLEWNSKEITLRSTYEGGYGCHYWYEEDWNS